MSIKPVKDRVRTRFRRKDGANLIALTCRFLPENMEKVVELAALFGESQSSVIERAVQIAHASITDEEKRALAALASLRKKRGVL